MGSKIEHDLNPKGVRVFQLAYLLSTVHIKDRDVPGRMAMDRIALELERLIVDMYPEAPEWPMVKKKGK